jgi:hypothetical protein
VLLVIIEIVFVAAIAAGVGLMFGIGAALVAGGSLGVLACEWTTVRRPR